MIQHTELRDELLKKDSLPQLIECSEKLSGLAKQYLLECLWTLSFDKPTAEKLRENSQFILSLQNIPKPDSSNEPAKDGIYKMADGLLWNLVKGMNENIKTR